MPFRLPRGDSGETGYQAITNMIRTGTRVLDLGCGDGELLARLAVRKGVKGVGVELSQELVLKCVARGLSVHHGDINEGLADCPEGSFDYVILSQTLQETLRPRLVIDEMLRVGKTGIISFPNFAYWRIRWWLAVRGRTPQTPELPYEWHDTPNVHFLSVTDFYRYCASNRIRVLEERFVTSHRHIHLWPNLRAALAIFAVARH